MLDVADSSTIIVHVSKPVGRIDFTTVDKVLMVLDDAYHHVNTIYLHTSDDTDTVKVAVEAQTAAGHHVAVYARSSIHLASSNVLA